MIERMTGLTPADVEREDPFFHYAYKAKLHRAISEAGYTARWELIDRDPLGARTHYRVRIEQRNGQRAWSSPIWVEV
jgi:hypothetical protein